MTNIYTNNANTNDSAKNTLDFFENYNKQQINLKSSDIDQFQSLLVKKGMQELAARETTTVILKQCNWHIGYNHSRYHPFFGSLNIIQPKLPFYNPYHPKADQKILYRCAQYEFS